MGFVNWATGFGQDMDSAINDSSNRIDKLYNAGFSKDDIESAFFIDEFGVQFPNIEPGDKDDYALYTYKLQNRLKIKGYYHGPVDGYYGPKTIAAVKEFQCRNDLTANGIVKADTWRALYDSSSRPATSSSFISNSNRSYSIDRVDTVQDEISKIWERLNKTVSLVHNCADCGAQLEIEENKPIFHCKYCGSTYIIGSTQIHSHY